MLTFYINVKFWEMLLIVHLQMEKNNLIFALKIKMSYANKEFYHPCDSDLNTWHLLEKPM